MNSIDYQLATMQAAKADAEIEYCYYSEVDGLPDLKWVMLRNSNSHEWNWESRYYRVKPPKPLVFWANVYPGGRADLHGTERVAIYFCRSGGRTIKLVEDQQK